MRVCTGCPGGRAGDGGVALTHQRGNQTDLVLAEVPTWHTHIGVLQQPLTKQAELGKRDCTMTKMGTKTPYA